MASNKSIRIRTTVGGNDNYLKIKLEQDFDFLEILSLKISQDKLYQTFCADYGVIIGRVTTNNSGFGVPNAKVSIFIPIDEYDKSRTDLVGLYPFESPNDKDIFNLRYNLLPEDKQKTNHTPVGSFPSKRKILDNDIVLEIYDKYYKFSTVTNDAGDYMIMGIPTGAQTLHVDVDLSDIGYQSLKPYDLIASGYNANMFESSSKFKWGNNLDALPQIISRNLGINILPFWGDKDSCEIGITRADVELNFNIVPTSLFIGSIVTDSGCNRIKKECGVDGACGNYGQLVTYEGTIETLRIPTDGGSPEFFSSEAIDKNGTWVITIPMNMVRKITDEFGNLIDSPDPDKGIYTEARVKFKTTLNPGTLCDKTRIGSYTIPNYINYSSSFPYYEDAERWGSDSVAFYTMKMRNVYSVRGYLPSVDNDSYVGIDRISDYVLFPYNQNLGATYGPNGMFYCKNNCATERLAFVIGTLYAPQFKYKNDFCMDFMIHNSDTDEFFYHSYENSGQPRLFSADIVNLGPIGTNSIVLNNIPASSHRVLYNPQPPNEALICALEYSDAPLKGVLSEYKIDWQPISEELQKLNNRHYINIIDEYYTPLTRSAAPNYNLFDGVGNNTGNNIVNYNYTFFGLKKGSTAIDRLRNDYL